MNAEQLSKVGSDLVRRCGTRDPFQIANALGINIMDDCENLGSLKGMYCIVKRNRFIFLNKDLSPQMKRIVCAHEIGHDRLHRALAKKHGLQEFVLYDMATKPEYEANIVAAEILLDSDEILEYIYDYGYTSEQIARAMHTDINLVALKIAHSARNFDREQIASGKLMVSVQGCRYKQKAEGIFVLPLSNNLRYTLVTSLDEVRVLRKLNLIFC